MLHSQIMLHYGSVHP